MNKRKTTHTLVVLHGITATSRSVAHAAAYLQQRLHADTVLTPALPFHGDGPLLEGYDIPTMVQWLDKFMNPLVKKGGRITVIGHSYAAAIVLYWAEAHRPTLPQVRCVALAPPLFITKTSMAVNLLPKRISWYILAAPHIKPLLQKYISTYPRHKLGRQRVYEATKFDDDSLERYLIQASMANALIHYAKTHPIKDVQQKTLLVVCGKDLVVSSSRLLKRFSGEQLKPNLYVELVPDSGHLLIPQNPERLADLIEAWEA